MPKASSLMLGIVHIGLMLPGIACMRTIRSHLWDLMAHDLATSVSKVVISSQRLLLLLLLCMHASYI
jgi:hypothetical protein